MANETFMDAGYLQALLMALPAYAEVRLTMHGGRSKRLMARDMPGNPERRYTCLDDGAEWFLPLAVATLGVRRIAVESLKIEVY